MLSGFYLKKTVCVLCEVSLIVSLIVQNAAARLVMGLPKFHSVLATIRDLHWLPLGQRTAFKAL